MPDDLSKNATVVAALDFVDWLDMHSFLTNYNVWHALNVDVNASNIWFPLPPCARLIPFQNLLWNIFKGKHFARHIAASVSFANLLLPQQQDRRIRRQNCMIIVKSIFQ